MVLIYLFKNIYILKYIMFQSSYMPDYVSLKQRNQLRLYNYEVDKPDESNTPEVPNNDKMSYIKSLCNLL